MKVYCKNCKHFKYQGYVGEYFKFNYKYMCQIGMINNEYICWQYKRIWWKFWVRRSQ